MQWKIIDSGKKSAQELMMLDAALLRDLREESQPILHLYEWDRDSLTYGYFIDPFLYLNREVLDQKGINSARRPTGGGIIFHWTDFAFSILIPASCSYFSLNTLDNYRLVNRWVAQSVHPLAKSKTFEFFTEEFKSTHTYYEKFCMAKPTIYDLMIGGRKVGGAAQRRTKDGYLHQGSIHLTMPSISLMRDILKTDWGVISAIESISFPLIGEFVSSKDLEIAKNKIKYLFLENLKYF